MFTSHFRNRFQAGEQLADRLEHLQGSNCIIHALPRGGVPVGFQVARRLDAPLEVLLVRKLGSPQQPELAVGAVGEGGIRVVDEDRITRLGITPSQLDTIEAGQRAELERQAQLFRAGRPAISPRGHTAVIVDDGIATGATARAACQVIRQAGADRLVVATPVAPRGWETMFAPLADECVAVLTPTRFWAIGFFYRDFSPTPDAEVIRLLSRAQNRPE